MAQVTCSGITKSFGARTAVEPLDLDVRDGEFVAILGPSGSGKSTILRMVAGLEPPTDGAMAFDGVDVTAAEPRHRDVGMFFQNYALFPNRTGAQNIGAPLRSRGVPEDEVAARVQEVAALLGVGHLLDRRPATYSGGEQQRVAIGRVIARRAGIYLFDEPLSNLDALVRVRLQTEFKRISRELGVTTLYVTPDQVEAMALADRIVVLRAGRVMQIGTPEELYARPANAFVAGFLGSPPMNLLRVRRDGAALVEEGEGLRIGLELGEEERARPAEGLVGVRPEALRLRPGGELRVRLKEVLGRTALIHLGTGGSSFRVVVDRDDPVQEDDRGGVSCDASALHWFTPDGSGRVDGG